jgi:hypothetical protein
MGSPGRGLVFQISVETVAQYRASKSNPIGITFAGEALAAVPRQTMRSRFVLK